MIAIAVVAGAAVLSAVIVFACCVAGSASEAGKSTAWRSRR